MVHDYLMVAGLPKRKSAVKAIEKIKDIHEWENCKENSEQFKIVAAMINQEFESESTSGVVNNHDTIDMASIPAHDNTDSEEEEEEDDDEYESSFIDDESVDENSCESDEEEEEEMSESSDEEESPNLSEDESEDEQEAEEPNSAKRQKINHEIDGDDVGVGMQQMPEINCESSDALNEGNIFLNN